MPTENVVAKTLAGTGTVNCTTTHYKFILCVFVEHSTDPSGSWQSVGGGCAPDYEPPSGDVTFTASGSCSYAPGGTCDDPVGGGPMPGWYRTRAVAWVGGPGHTEYHSTGSVYSAAVQEGCPLLPVGDTGVAGPCAITAPPSVPSGDCVAPTATVIDGYFGTLYARLRVQQQGLQTWVCARLQPEGGTELAGGKFTASEATPVTQDSNYTSCASQTDNAVPGSHPMRSGAIGDPSDPPYVPYLLDAYANSSGAAWLCLQAGLGARVKFSGVGTVFAQDDPSLAVSPPRTPWTPGKASSDCETQMGGTKTRLVNAVISGTQVWLTVWRSGSKTQLCVRAQGSSSAGGRLLVDSAASPGTPVFTQGTDTSACTVDVFSDDQEDLYVRRSATGTNPASVCVTKGTTSQRFTAGYTGSVDPPDVTWALDN